MLPGRLLVNNLGDSRQEDGSYARMMAMSPSATFMKDLYARMLLTMEDA